MGAYHIGVDEAGRGPAIGPLVVCALCIPNEDRGILAEIGVDDSKNLTRRKRESIHSEIIAISESRGWKIGLIHCDAERIDLWMESGTLNSLEVVAFSDAIEEVAENSLEYSIFLDACDVDAARFGRNVSSSLRNKGESWRIFSRHRMDSDDVVTGAASIIAKVNRDWAMDKLSRELEIDLGSGYPSDPKSKTAIEYLCKDDPPNDCLRRKWKNVDRAWVMRHRKPIPSRPIRTPREVQSALDEWN
ncbi:MAG: ribonuclease HII [Euryarchaeota archaeon]|jgi:ribonuclease HII|nr:ribonuclease HII [Euryarchaeota archaeon]